MYTVYIPNIPRYTFYICEHPPNSIETLLICMGNRNEKLSLVCSCTKNTAESLAVI